MAKKPLDRVRAICLALPEAYEEETWDTATFRVRRKIFCMVDGHAPVDPSVTMKTAREEQQALLAQGGPYFFPAYVGSKGWIGVRLSDPDLDWDEVTELITESFRLVAPKRVAALLER